MRPIQRVISAGFATAAIASASLPALSGTVWPNVDFEWYANVGKGRVQQADVSGAATREGRTGTPGASDARTRGPIDTQGTRAGDAAAHRAAPPPTSSTFPTGPATTRGPDSAIATTTPPAAAEEISRR